MRIAGMILGILGGLVAGFLGMKWMSDANSLRPSIDFARKVGVNMAELDKMTTTSYMLIGAMMAGILGGILAAMGKGKIAALLMLAGAILPAVWAPKTLLFTCILLIGGIVSFFAKPQQTAASP